MSRKTQTQWEFGELPLAAPARVVFTVTELTARVRRLLEQQIGPVTVTGEVSNLRVQSSGHVYFTLKDAGAQLSCVLWRSTSIRDRELMRDGQKLVAQGDLTVYEPRGQYQLVVRSIEVQGVGALQVAFEKLKQKLSAEGLFAPERKRGLPRFPRRIGLVTSPTGAAIRDVLHVIARRDPSLEIVLAPCRVQGEGAAAEIAAAVARLNAWSSQPGVGAGLNLILLTRGGGSMEDLWSFNEECVARAIHESVLPVISAVGHEIDFTISDFAADLRAATPSAAAELITESVFAVRPWLEEAPVRLRQWVARRVAAAQAEFDQLRQRFGYLHPRRVLNDRLQLLDDLMADLGRRVRSGWKRREELHRHAVMRLQAVRPSRRIARQSEAVGLIGARLRAASRARFTVLRHRLATAEARLRLLSPLQVLDRGYSITMDAASGRLLRVAEEVVAGQRLRTRLQSGVVESIAQPGETGSAGA
ncbi:MAG: exodeoxyribonuclease VII large subunit [Verrucomicrobia bacterium]|nr:exodeoxyribonuclease VII large subunit [Verrucomicrobiota bacterium]